MCLLSLPPDKYYRFSTAARYLKQITSRLDNHGLLCDAGSQSSILNQFLPESDFVLSDINLSQEKNFVQASITQLPFCNNHFTATTCLDVLEHLPVDQRLNAAKEVIRVSSHGCIFAFPHAHPENQMLERQLQIIHHDLTGEDNRFLLEHEQHGLVDQNTVSSVTTLLKEKFQHVIIFGNFPRLNWFMSHFLSYTLGLMPEGNCLQTTVFNWLNTLLTESPIATSYRTFIAGSTFTLESSNDSSEKKWTHTFPDLNQINKPVVSSFKALNNLSHYASQLESNQIEKDLSYKELENYNQKLLEETERLNKIITQLDADLKDAEKSLSEKDLQLNQIASSKREILDYVMILENNLHKKDHHYLELQEWVLKQLLLLGNRNG